MASIDHIIVDNVSYDILDKSAVSFAEAQTLTDVQQAQARENVGAGTYSKPSGGIPASDMAEAVQTSLGKADTALQTAPVSSVAGKTGAVTLDAGDVEYDGTETYSEGTVGADLSALKTYIRSRNGPLVW